MTGKPAPNPTAPDALGTDFASESGPSPLFQRNDGSRSQQFAPKERSRPDCGTLSPLSAFRCRRAPNAAEQFSLIDDLTMAVLDRAAHDRRTAADKGIFLNSAINVSLKNLRDADIVERMLETVSSELGEPSDFTLEVTETHLVDDLAKVLEPLLRLRLLGFKIALDDYGTGASSMQLLSQLPSTELKIDRSFVSAGPRSVQGRAFMQSAVELGRQMGQSIVAEGIETEEERALALELGCQIGQGYLFSRPLPLEELLAMTGGMLHIADGTP